MQIYKLTQSVNNGYDTYDSCIVAAENEEDARIIPPIGSCDFSYCWAPFPNQVEVELIGTAIEGTQRGVILASFNAG